MNSIEQINEQGDALRAQDLRMGEALVARSKLKQEDVDRILELQKNKNILFGEAAKQLGLLKDSDLKKILSEQYDYSYFHDGSQLSHALVAAHKPFSDEVEHLRSLRGQLLLRWFDQGNKTLAIISTDTEDSADVLSANLAIVFSQLNKKTLLIDANLRQPSQQKLFNIETRVGLANILANRQGNYQLSRFEALPNLSVLTAGTEVPNPQELLSKSAFVELLHDLEVIYDIIIIQSAPSALGFDYLTVAAKAKGVVIVARKDYTKANDLILLNQQLSMTGTKVIGSVYQEL
ncbi:MAG TPA: capsular biosynthesis protein [Methylophilaceae bacterium]|nr:capsular biosynthesis protein [Methylophilaceae bacterium]HAJ72066.1 capsular biosynthesis protein [Methylophilaceae bacterium]